ncbi:MAG: lipopolysaccharide kinase InaA family protein [Tannerella sp.]|jgi:serine/threonine protein kinase|nr:lipopolysaccharide kinase InaA family protein [Tannerella sp.]
MKITVNPKYEHLRPFVERLPQDFDNGGELLHKQRNTVKKFDLGDGLSLNVKRFGKPHFLNRIIYTFFRKSKAYRSYENTFEIAGRGFDVADAVAFIEKKSAGLLSDSFFVSVQLQQVHEIRRYYSGPLDNMAKEVLWEFGKYTAALHDAGIFHPDYSPGNILITNQETSPRRFCLIDLNRVKFGKVSLRKGLRNFERLFIDDDPYLLMAGVYPPMRNQFMPPTETFDYMLKYRNRYIKHRERKNRRKKL